MKIIRFSIFVLFFFLISGVTNSQNLKENELVVIQGKKFILHQVRTGETVYSISRSFKIDSSELYKFNPEISKGLSIGDILKIPFNEDVEITELPNIKKGDPTGFIEHTIDSKNETAYSISKIYGITVEEIYAYNPSVRKLRKGLTLKIPQWNYASKPEPVAENGQKETPAVVNTAGSGEMIEHVVVSGETLYSIGKRYQLTEAEIIAYNPEARNLKAGTRLSLPNKQVKRIETEAGMDKSETSNMVLHTIVSGETIYGITKKYNVSEAELVELNPELKTGFRTGTIIKIPLHDRITTAQSIENDAAGENEIKPSVPPVAVTGSIPEDCRPAYGNRYRETVKVALFLPLFLDANINLNKDFLSDETNQGNEPDTTYVAEDTEGTAGDTIIEQEQPVHLFKQFHGNSERFLQFYEGVLLAVDSMQKAGMKIELDVYDTEDSPAKVRRVVNSEAFKTTDLILGPVYEHLQKEVAPAALQYQIPMVSPFTPKSEIISGNQQFYQINPTREYLIDATTELVVPGDSIINFVVLKTAAYEGTPEGQFVEMVRRKLEFPEYRNKAKFTVYDFQKNRARGLSQVLLPNHQNLVFIPSSDEGELSVAISNLNNIAREFPITLIGAANYQQKYPSIEVAHFHNLNLKYINPYWVNYNDKPTIAFFEKFITNFGTEPNSYGIQGFDASWYFLNAIYYFGKDFENCLPYINLKLLQGNYYFQKVSQGGGYMNQGVSLISYTPDFEVVRKKIIGQPQFKDQ